MKTKKLYYHMKQSVDLSKLPEIKGYDFEKGTDRSEEHTSELQSH